MDRFSSMIDDELLNHGLVSGVLVVVRHTGPVYSHGMLSRNIPKEQWSQFLPMFKDTSSSFDQAVCNRGFDLNVGSKGDLVEFKIYQKTACSAYGVSVATKDGLIVCNLPHSVLICLFPAHQNPSHVIRIVENFADKLRR